MSVQAGGEEARCKKFLAVERDAYTGREGGFVGSLGESVVGGKVNRPPLGAAADVWSQ